jgi:hypothetical protein
MIPLFVHLTEVNRKGTELGSIIVNLSQVTSIATRQESDDTPKVTVILFTTDKVAVLVSESAQHIGNMISDATEQM